MIQYNFLISSQNGGSPILGYDLWRDDGANGDYQSLFSVDNVLANFFLDANVKKGLLYRYKYRARNINGWGDFSNPGYLFAADAPSQPQAPTLKEVTSTYISLDLYAPEDTGGSGIIGYQLYKDQGSLNSVFAAVSSYTGGSLSITLYTSDGLTLGNLYSFQFRARNLIGYSDFSEITRVGFGAQILPPSNVQTDLTKTGPNYITINWSIVQDADLPTLGYSVEMLTGNHWTEVYSAQYNQNANSFTKYGLTTGEQYTFRVFAINFNGKSDPSTSISVYACGVPSGLAPPTYVASDQSSITI